MAVLAFGFAIPSHAQADTNSALYQQGMDITGELALLHEANGSHAEKVRNAPAITNRLPRHVFQKAREVLVKVQVSRKLNGLPLTKTPPIPAKQITAADITPVLALILKDVRDLRPKFAVSKQSPKTTAVDGKSSNDVYVLLEKANHAIDGLDIPHINPNEVLQIAETIVADLEAIRAKRGLTDKIAYSSGAKKKPKAVYQHAFELMKALKNVTESNAAYKIDGGIALTAQKAKGRVAGNQVIENLNNVMADVAAMKVKVGVNKPTVWAALKSGNKPGNVFDAVDTAIKLANSLK
tara:strand:- start:3952 stop:4836 length:885 start_codon:yes stop_codon:yes gene_type:complete